MRDISSKTSTLRTALAAGFVRCPETILEIIQRKELPKGDPFGVCLAAGLLGAKKTAELIPHCHPVSIDGMELEFILVSPKLGCPEIWEHYQNETGVLIVARLKSIGRTGIEMEALTAVSVAALTLYDLLKPLGNKEIEITGLKLFDKKGGKSGHPKYPTRYLKVALLIGSDAIVENKKKDTAGPLVKQLLEAQGCEITAYRVSSEKEQEIKPWLEKWIKEEVPFIFTLGGTGLSNKDITTDVVASLIERKVEGITEAMRIHSYTRTPVAMMSRLVAGTAGKSTLVTLPGSSNGAKESLEALLPTLFHAGNMLDSHLS